MSRTEEIKGRLEAAPRGPYRWEGPFPAVNWALGVYVCRGAYSEACYAESPAYQWVDIVAFREMVEHAPVDLAWCLARIEALETFVRRVHETARECPGWGEPALCRLDRAAREALNSSESP